MTTLAEYAHQHFPQHPVTGPDHGGDVALASHTVVAQVIGRETGRRVEEALRAATPGGRVRSIVVMPTEPTLANTGGEDKEGVFDLPAKRVATGAIVAGVLVGAAVGIIAGFAIGNAAAGIILGVFAAIIGGVLGFLFSGGGRYAGNRAWEQAQHADRSVVLVAAMLDDEATAHRVAGSLGTLPLEDVRIVGSDGSWHSPNV